MSVFSRSTYRKVSLIKCLISARFSLYSLSSLVGSSASFEIAFHSLRRCSLLLSVLRRSSSPFFVSIATCNVSLETIITFLVTLEKKKKGKKKLMRSRSRGKIVLNFSLKRDETSRNEAKTLLVIPRTERNRVIDMQGESFDFREDRSKGTTRQRRAAGIARQSINFVEV